MSEDELKRRLEVWRARADAARDPLERAANERLAAEYAALLDHLFGSD